MNAWDDLQLLRRHWHWNSIRPAGWPEPSDAIPGREADLAWARREPVRTVRLLIQRGLMRPVNQLMTAPDVTGEEWLESLTAPVIFAANHVSHADTPLLLGAMPDRVRERTVVAAAQDYFYQRPFLGRLLSLYLNTFPFSRTGGAQAVLHASGQLLRSGWNLLIYPEGTRSEDGRLQPFRPGIGHLALDARTSVVPMHVAGTTRVLPKGTRVPAPGKVTIRVGKPLQPARGDNAREFTARIEQSVRELAGQPTAAVTGSWIDRWRAVSL